MSEDPIGFAGGDYNLYRYVGSNPVKLTDPTGTFLIAPPLLLLITTFLIEADSPMTKALEDGYPILNKPRPTTIDLEEIYDDRKRLENLIRKIEDEKNLPAGSCKVS